ncbi:PIR protein [Plasmodium ovale]|uniref:PIR protein n=1 Tax=Plasmodium ovale TaxID=36330 RepID=A0A1D3JC09_PLAOA|nr:PIR protein [Plasmodium ovale]
MKCDTKKPNNESYGFFEEFDYYEGIVKSAEKINSVVTNFILENPEEYDCDEIVKSCYYFLIHNIASTKESPHIICEQFKKIYNLLKYRTRTVDSVKHKNNDYAFMNYWLNDKLSDNNNDLPICVKGFYKELVKIDGEYFNIPTLEEKLYNMEKHDLENMKNLYELYNIKNKISTAISEENDTGKGASCSTYTKECYAKYRDAIINCLDGCFDFYTALMDFRNTLKAFSYYTNTSISCKYKELFELPDYETVLKEHKSGSFRRIITLPLLFPLLGMFFMFIYSDTAFEKIKSTKNMLFGARERSNELLSYISDNDNIIGDHEEYSIGYYSVGNY